MGRAQRHAERLAARRIQGRPFSTCSLPTSTGVPQVYAGQLRDALAGDPDQRHLVVSLFDAPEAALRADIRLRVRSGLLRQAGLDPVAVARLRRAIRDQHADVVVAHGGEPLKYVVAAAGRTPTVYYKVGLSSTELSRPSRRRLYRFLASRATHVVGVSEAIVDQAHDVLGVPRARLSVIPNGRDPGTYHPPTGDESRADPPLVLFVGHLEPGKRPGLFLDVVGVLRSRALLFDAAVVGDGPLRAGLESRAAALGVEILGIRTDVADLLRGTSVLLMTSAAATEGMPGVLIEAGLSGIPVVSTASAGVADVVIDGATGFVESDDPVQLAGPVQALLTDAGLHEAMGDRAGERCRARFTIAATATQWRRLASTLVDPGGSRRG